MWKIWDEFCRIKAKEGLSKQSVRYHSKVVEEGEKGKEEEEEEEEEGEEEEEEEGFNLPCPIARQILAHALHVCSSKPI